jgi:hypothetical protein
MENTEDHLSDLIQSFAIQNIHSQKKLLYVDGLNYCRDFFTGGPKWISPQKVTQRVYKFVRSAQNSGWTLEVFIDMAAVTDETLIKWKNRRKKEIKERVRNMPQGCNALLGEMFKRAGVRVHYSYEADCDDTIVAYAHANGASILSQDNDMFRYTEANITVYSQYSLKNGGISLKLHKNDGKMASPRKVISPPPATLENILDLSIIRKSLSYLRGSPSPLTRDLGNLHITV